jgi:hypothetical protein
LQNYSNTLPAQKPGVKASQPREVSSHSLHNTFFVQTKTLIVAGIGCRISKAGHTYAGRGIFGPGGRNVFLNADDWSTISRTNLIPIALLLNDERVQQEWYEVRSEVAYQRELAKARHPQLHKPVLKNTIYLQFMLYIDCWTIPILKRTQVGVGLMFFHHFVGINALIVSHFGIFCFGMS